LFSNPYVLKFNIKDYMR